MPVYQVQLNETWKVKNGDEQCDPILADPVNVLAGSADEAIEVAKASAMLKEDQGELDAEKYYNVMSRVSLERVHRICDIDLHVPGLLREARTGAA